MTGWVRGEAIGQMRKPAIVALQRPPLLPALHPLPSGPPDGDV